MQKSKFMSQHVLFSMRIIQYLGRKKIPFCAGPSQVIGQCGIRMDLPDYEMFSEGFRLLQAAFVVPRKVRLQSGNTKPGDEISPSPGKLAADV